MVSTPRSLTEGSRLAFHSDVPLGESPAWAGRLRICLLSDESPEDFDPSPFMFGYDWELVTLSSPVAEQVTALARSGRFDVFMNLCEGHEAEAIGSGKPGYHGHEVVVALERAGVAFTGADSGCYDPTREEMQAVAEAVGVGFAKGWRVQGVAEALERVKSLRFPIMVKHPSSYGSTGMYRESRADTAEQVATQVARICTSYGAARVEEFIVGKEYNVLIVDHAADLGDAIAYPPVELVFPPGEEFWHTDVKWNYSVPFAFLRVTDAALAVRLQEESRRLYLALGMTGYARCDMRVTDAGELHILELNPNPGIMFPLEEYGPADYIILYDAAGYRGFFDRVLRAAFARERVRRSRLPAAGAVPVFAG